MKQAGYKPKTLMSLFSPQKIQAFINGNSIYPGSDAGLPFELTLRLKNFYKNILRNIFGLFGILQKTKRRIKHQTLVGFYQLLQVKFIFGVGRSHSFTNKEKIKYIC
jgi:hypothetical protein